MIQLKIPSVGKKLNYSVLSPSYSTRGSSSLPLLTTRRRSAWWSESLSSASSSSTIRKTQSRPRPNKRKKEKVEDQRLQLIFVWNFLASLGVEQFHLFCFWHVWLMHLKNTVLSFLFSILMKNSRINWSSLFYSFCWSYYLLILKNVLKRP
jgi:hypothetical protein